LGDYDKCSTEDFVKKYFPTASEKPKAIPTPTVKEGLLKAEISDTIYDNIQLPAIAIGISEHRN
jgi:hypothetical protein